ncbi:hypothetical protein REPUB_Repub04eG0221500 [Reevesia pubescens]
MVLVSPILSRSSYHSWCRLMKMALLTKNKLQLVDGSIPALVSTSPVFSAWQRCNTMVLS